MKIYMAPLLIISLLTLSLGIFVYIKNRKQSLNRIFFLLCVATFIWLFGRFISDFYGNSVYLWLRFSYCGVVFIAITIFHYIVELLRVRSLKKLALVNYFIGGIWSGLIWLSPYLIDGVRRYSWGYYPVAGRFHFLILFYFVSLVTASFMLSSYFLWFKKGVSPFKKTRLSISF